jgi:hypothetical protein
VDGGGVGLGWSRTTDEWTRGCSSRRSGDVGVGSGVTTVGGQATSTGLRRLEVGRRRRGLRGRGGRRSGDVRAGSGVTAVGGWASSEQPPGSWRPEVGRRRRVSPALSAGGRATLCLADLSVGGWLPQCRKQMVVERLSASGEMIRRSGIFSVNTFNSKGRYKWDGANRCETPFSAFRTARQFSRIAPH